MIRFLPILFFALPALAQQIEIKQTEALCPYCTHVMRQQVEIYRHSMNSKLQIAGPGRKVILFLPDESILAAEEASVQRKLYGQLSTTEFGESLIKRVNSIRAEGAQMRFRLFYQMELDQASGRSASGGWEPLWVQEAREPHDVYGFFHVKDKNATLLLNNFQTNPLGMLSTVHELFHLVDGDYAERIADPKQDPELVHFIAEYRALLAELEFYQQGKKAGLFPKKSDFHESLFTFSGKVNHQKLLETVLELEFPAKRSPRFAIDRAAKVHFLEVHRKSYNNYCMRVGESDLAEAEKNISNVLTQLLKDKPASEDGCDLSRMPQKDQGMILEYSPGKARPEAVIKAHQAEQAKVLAAIQAGGGLESWLAKNRITDLTRWRASGWNQPPAEGGPKARDDGDVREPPPPPPKGN